MLYVDTGGLDRCHPGGKPTSGAAEAGCELQLYGEKLQVAIPAMYQIPGAPVKVPKRS